MVNIMMKYDPTVGYLHPGAPSYLKGYDHQRQNMLSLIQAIIGDVDTGDLESREEYQKWWDAQPMRDRCGTILPITQGEWKRLNDSSPRTR